MNNDFDSGKCIITTGMKNQYSDIEMSFHDIAQNTDAWDELRRKKLTASCSHTTGMAITTKGYTGLVDKKAYERAFNEPVESEFSGNYSTQRGHEMEPYAVEEYEKETYRECCNGGFYQLGEYLGASPDSRLKGLNGGLEIKCFEHKHHEDVLTNPDKFVKDNFEQVQFQMYVCGFDFIDLYAYHPNYRSYRVTIKPDMEFQEKLKANIEIMETHIEAEMKRKLSLVRGYREE